MKYEPIYQCLACGAIFRTKAQVDPRASIESAIRIFADGLNKYTVHHRDGDSVIGVGRFIGFVDADDFVANDGYNKPQRMD